MCFDIERFIDQEIAGDLICSICQEVLCCPQLNKTQPTSKQEQIKGTEGGHKFCEKCIVGWLKNSKTCPDCRDPLDINNLQPLERFTSNTLKRLRIHCKHYKNGCNHVDKLELIEQHELNCQYDSKKCPKCGQLIDIMNAHSDNDCIDKLSELVKAKNNEIQNNNKTIQLLNNDLREMNIQLEIKEKEKDEIKTKYENKINQLNEIIKQLQNHINSANIHTERPIKAQRELKTPKPRSRSNSALNTREILKLCESSENNYQHIKQLIEQRNINPNYADKTGNTALMKASQNGHLDIVTLLLDNNANILAKDNYGMTALMIASANGHLDIVKLLIDRGASINDKDNDGWTATMIASNWRRKDVLNYLKSKGGIV